MVAAPLPRIRLAIWPWKTIARIIGIATMKYCRIASAPTPITLPESSWNGVAAASTTSMTREFFSSATL